MQISDDMRKIPLLCFLDGRRKVLPFEEAYKLFWRVTFSWLLPLDWFRSGFRKSATDGYAGKIAQQPPMRFAFKMLTRGALALAINDSALLDEHGDSPSHGLLYAWAARFGKLFKGPKPYEYMKVSDQYGRRQPAYRMKPGETWLIVIGVDPENHECTDLDVDWELFQVPREAAVPS